MWIVKREDMPKRLIHLYCLIALLLLLAMPAHSFAQEAGEAAPKADSIVVKKNGRIKHQKPNQLDVWKLDLFQCGINEIRLWYEFQVSDHSSFEIGLGGIFPNEFWLDRGERPMIATGGGVYFAFRQYMDKKRYFSEPKLRSYFSPLLFYRYSTYQDEWFKITTADPLINDCSLQSEQIHQAAAVIRFGWQTTQGRIALDMYSGLGFKFIPSTRITSVHTDNTAVCEINSNSVMVNEVTKFSGANVIFNAGVKLGIRRNNKERHYEDDAPADGTVDPDSPPQF